MRLAVEPEWGQQVTRRELQAVVDARIERPFVAPRAGGASRALMEQVVLPKRLAGRRAGAPQRGDSDRVRPGCRAPSPTLSVTAEACSASSRPMPSTRNRSRATRSPPATADDGRLVGHRAGRVSSARHSMALRNSSATRSVLGFHGRFGLPRQGLDGASHQVRGTRRCGSRDGIHGSAMDSLAAAS